MKSKNTTYLLTGAAAMLICTAAALFWWQYQPEKGDKTEHLLVLIDITDATRIDVPTGAELHDIIGFNVDLWKGFHLRIRLISEIVYSDAIDILLPAQNFLFSSRMDRLHDVRELYKELDVVLSQVKDSTEERMRSSIYKTLASELNILADQPPSQKRVLMFSDLREYSDLLDTYSYRTLQALQNNPDAIRTQIESTVNWSDLTGIDIQIIYDPVDLTDAQVFEVMASMTETILEQHGAQVTITNHLEF